MWGTVGISNISSIPSFWILIPWVWGGGGGDVDFCELGQSGAKNLIRFYIGVNWGDKMVFTIQKANLVDFSFSQLFMWIGTNNDPIWHPMAQTSDYEQCSNQLQLDLISRLFNFSGELGQIMIRYDFLWARRVILSNVRTDSGLT